MRATKTKNQKDSLWRLYRQLGGILPSKAEIERQARLLDLRIDQIYKWFWDTRKKVEEDNSLAQKSEDKLTAKGPGSKAIVQGRSGLGDELTPQQIKTALKVSQDAEVEHNEFIRLAYSLKIDVEKIAQDLIALPSPQGTR